jgi:hypothetical protein
MSEAHTLRLQRVRNRIRRFAGNLDRCTPVRESHAAFNIPSEHDCIAKLCRAEAEVVPNYVNPNVRGIGQGEAMRKKYKRLKLGGGQAYDCSGE